MSSDNYLDVGWISLSLKTTHTHGAGLLSVTATEPCGGQCGLGDQAACPGLRAGQPLPCPEALGELLPCSMHQFPHLLNGVTAPTSLHRGEDEMSSHV